MENRITQRDESGFVHLALNKDTPQAVINHAVNEAIALLAAYEDTGLTPKQVMSLTVNAEWVGDIFNAHCSNCGNSAVDGCLPGSVGNYMVMSHFCPSCGAKMKNGNASV